MRGEFPELKKKLKKEKFTFKKANAMLTTWSDEDEDEDAQASSGDEEIHYLMARSEDSTEVNSSFENYTVDEWEEAYTLLFEKFYPLHFSIFFFFMASKGKRLASRRHPLSPEVGEGSTAPVECRSKHRDDCLLELIVPHNLNTSRVWGTFTKFVQPRFVHFESLEDMFPRLRPLFDTQGWTTFLYSHTRYSPTTVIEFYNNLQLSMVGDALYTMVKGITFQITPNLFTGALQIPNSGANILVHPPSTSDYYTLITHQLYHPSVDHLKLNANTFPLLNCLIHHIFTTIVVPKDGSRELVTTVDNFFDLTAVHHMGYKFVDGIVTRTLKGQVGVEEEFADDADDDAGEDSQDDPMDAPGANHEDAEDQAPQDPAQSLRDLITGQMAQLQDQDFERLNALGRQVRPIVLVGALDVNVMAVRIAFWLPPLGSTSACAPHVAHGVGFADIGKARRHLSPSRSVGPYVRDCETERLFLCCVVRVGYWSHEPVVCPVWWRRAFRLVLCYRLYRVLVVVLPVEVCHGVGTVVIVYLMVVGMHPSTSELQRSMNLQRAELDLLLQADVGMHQA
ncbi:hypothetical protein Taro_031428 [Colocasia esculenta]|uniref:Uncharacterized protein n=1 Tax=Colocasia esculenta TaxID=4460 RepID=A0A843W341_COLES|nr:hypothetical protein [Colocasia esculenta]